MPESSREVGRTLNIRAQSTHKLFQLLDGANGFLKEVLFEDRPTEEGTHVAVVVTSRATQEPHMAQLLEELRFRSGKTYGG